jgi:hypothetical protein
MSTLVRPLGTLERFFYRYSERNPDLFIFAAEFGTALAPDDVARALAAVQRRHPLMSVHVEEHQHCGLGFFRTDSVGPIALSVHETDPTQWQPYALAELGWPFDQGKGPLVRATLLVGADRSTVLLTFDHTIADGISSSLVMDDLVRALNGAQLDCQPEPPTIEDLTERNLPAPQEFPSVDDVPADPRMLRPAQVRRFDGNPGALHTVELGKEKTSRLVRLCRSEGVTVHSALATATALVRAELTGEDYIRALTPINVRDSIGAQDDCAVYIGFGITRVAPKDGKTFWEHARAVAADLKQMRTTQAVVNGVSGLNEVLPPGAGVEVAEQFITTAVPADMMITNLGIRTISDSGPIRPTALWGPIVRTQIDGEHSTGAVTYQGRLRLVTAAAYSPHDFLDGVAAVLRAVS